MFTFTKFAEKKLRKLDAKTQAVLGKQLKQVRESGLAGRFEPILGFLPATHRLHLEGLRLILARDGDDDWTVLDVGHLKKIYE